MVVPHDFAVRRRQVARFDFQYGDKPGGRDDGDVEFREAAPAFRTDVHVADDRVAVGQSCQTIDDEFLGVFAVRGRVKGGIGNDACHGDVLESGVFVYCTEIILESVFQANEITIKAISIEMFLPEWG